MGRRPGGGKQRRLQNFTSVLAGTRKAVNPTQSDLGVCLTAKSDWLISVTPPPPLPSAGEQSRLLRAAEERRSVQRLFLKKPTAVAAATPIAGQIYLSRHVLNRKTEDGVLSWFCFLFYFLVPPHRQIRVWKGDKSRAILFKGHDSYLFCYVFPLS